MTIESIQGLSMSSGSSITVGSMDPTGGDVLVGGSNDIQTNQTGFLEAAMESIQASHSQAADAVVAYERTGNQAHLTQAVLALSKIRSDMALYATVRDKIIQSYNQLSNMQI